MPPTRANGKVCYIEIPAVDIERSAEFYASVFGWRLRKRGDGHTACRPTGITMVSHHTRGTASHQIAWPRGDTRVVRLGSGRTEPRE